MPLSDDVLDGRIRTALHGTSVDDVDTASAEAAVRVTAASRRTRRRVLGGVGSVALAALLGIVLISVGSDDTVVTDVPAASTTSSSLSADYGFAPLTPLLDAPLSVIASTELTVVDGHILSVESTAETVSLRLTYPAGSVGALGGDPMTMPALLSFSSGPSSSDDDSMSYEAGITRSEVARVDMVTAAGVVTVVPIESSAFPQLRFFLIKVPDGVASPEEMRGQTLLIAYDADGRILTDSNRIHAESAAFVDAMDRRAGVEEKAAGVLDVRVSDDGRLLMLRVFNCGGDVGDDVRVAWTVDETTVRISATVKRPYAEGDCLDGDTVELGVGLEEPLGNRVILDDRTGDPIPLRSEG